MGELLAQCYSEWYTNMKLGKWKAYQVRIIVVLKMVTTFFKLLKTMTQNVMHVIFLSLLNKIN